MAENEKILDQDTIDNIYRTMLGIFSEEGGKTVIKDIKEFKQQLQKIINEMDIQLVQSMAYYGNQWHSQMRYKMQKEVQHKNILAAEGYLLIFKFREYLLGNPAMEYRYYFMNKNDQIEQRVFDESNILNFMKFDDNKIILNANKIIDLGNKKQNIEFMSFFNQYYKHFVDNEKFMKNMGYQNLRRVRKSIYTKYSYNKGLLHKSSNRYQLFNSGHLFEAMDITLTQALMDDVISDQDSVESLFFGKFLKRDNVLASKGGDNYLINASIKSNNASLYSYNTIFHQLGVINEMLNKSNSYDFETLRKNIIDLYIDDTEKSEKTKNQIQDIADTAANKLLDLLKNNKI